MVKKRVKIEKNQGKVTIWSNMAGSFEPATSSSSTSRWKEEDARDYGR